MLLCLSSAAKPRYRQDILRALSMPPGARLQFRYALKWVAHGLRDRARANELKGTEVCIAYLDIATTTEPLTILPVRSAKLFFTEVQGDFCVLEFELQGFAFAQDVDAFNRQLRTQSGNLPAWKDGAPLGNYCEEITAKGLPLKFDADVGEWQQICKAISSFSAYRQEQVFYRLEGVYRTDNSASALCKDAVFELCSGNLYDLRLLHYSPGALTTGEENKDLNWLVVEGDDKATTFVRTKMLAVDSNYDVKTIRVRAATTTLPMDGRLSCSRRKPGAVKPEESIWDFDMQVRIQPRWWTLTWQGLMVGIPVAAQGLVLTFNNPNIVNTHMVAVLVTVAGLAAGLAASFGLRKA